MTVRLKVLRMHRWREKSPSLGSPELRIDQYALKLVLIVVVVPLRLADAVTL